MAVVINGQVYENLVQIVAKEGALDERYIVGDSDVIFLALPEDCAEVKGDFHHWTALEEVYVAKYDAVVLGLDTKFGSGITFWVADDMLTAYETAYPALTFQPWTNYHTWTIPYVSGVTPTTLTAEYVQSELANNPIASYATKVVVPDYFVDYEDGCFTNLKQLCPNVSKLEILRAQGSAQWEFYGRWIFQNKGVPLDVSLEFKATASNLIWNIQLSDNSETIERTAETTISGFADVTTYQCNLRNVRVCGASTYKTLSAKKQDKTWIISDTLVDFTKAGNVTFDYVYVNANVLQQALVSSAGGYVSARSKLVGYLDYDGTNIPTFSGYTDQWYEDEDCTTPIATSAFVSGTRYFVKLTAI